MSPLANSPKVGVLIPAYNRSQYIGTAIQSVLNQTYPHFEVVVVDDGSSDDTVAKVRQFTDPRVRLICQKNTGVSGALNTALRASRGHYIAILGSDDLWLPEFLSTAIPVLDERMDIGLVYGRAQAMTSDGHRMRHQLGRPPKFQGQMFKSLVHGDHVCGISVLIRREHIETVGLWDEGLTANEDWDLWLRLSRVCPFLFIDQVFAHYRIHAQNMTNPRSKTYHRLIQDRFRVLDKVFQQPDLPPEIRSMESLAYYNVNLYGTIRWISVHRWREGIHYLIKAFRIFPRPMTFLRIPYVILRYGYFNEWAWGGKLLNFLWDLRTRVKPQDSIK
jgi:glycosyltransferase involved in cell wall biosynthesis